MGLRAKKAFPVVVATPLRRTGRPDRCNSGADLRLLLREQGSNLRPRD